MRPQSSALDEAVAAITTSTQTVLADSSAAGPQAEELSTLDGTWEAISGNGSFAGYRVQEELALPPAYARPRVRSLPSSGLGPLWPTPPSAMVSPIG